MRCDKNKPCANCVKAQIECRIVPPQPPRRRKKKLTERELLERVKRYETLLTENGIELDAAGIAQSCGNGDNVGDLEDDLSALKTTNKRVFAFEREVSLLSTLQHFSLRSCNFAAY